MEMTCPMIDFGGGQGAESNVEIVLTCDEEVHKYPSAKVLEFGYG